MAPACIAAFRTKSSSFAVLMMTRVLGETAWSSFWTSRPLIPDMKISRTARATVLQITYVRKASGSLNNCACKPTDESKRSRALSIDGSSATRQIMPAAGGPTADEYRGRDIHCWMPPAQIPAGVIHAPGSHLGWLTTNPTSSFAYTVEALGHGLSGAMSGPCGGVPCFASYHPFAS